MESEDGRTPEEEVVWIKDLRCKPAFRISATALDTLICGFMMFYGKDSVEKRIFTKYKRILHGKQIQIYRLVKHLKTTTTGPRGTHIQQTLFFRVDENNRPVRSNDGKPIFYRARRHLLSKTLAMEEIRRYDHVVNVRLMYNTLWNQTRVVAMEMGFRDGDFYSRDISLEKLKNHIPDELLFRGDY